MKTPKKLSDRQIQDILARPLPEADPIEDDVLVLEEDIIYEDDDELYDEDEEEVEG